MNSSWCSRWPPIRTRAAPPGSEILYEKIKDPQTQQMLRGQAYVVERRAALTGNMLSDARALPDQYQFGQYYVQMRLNSRGKRLFARLTQENVGRALAIVLDDTIFSAPVIQEPILGGEAQITGTFTPEEARDLAIVLREGALPAPVSIIENRTVGPSLGSDSISRGVRSTILGGVLVILFMMTYYRMSGLVADVALGLNLLILMGVLALPGLGATLTLPGIAGVLLTLGMAIDANVLIFERIREEMRLGKSVRGAVDAGFGRAFTAILDAQRHHPDRRRGAVPVRFGTRQGLCRDPQHRPVGQHVHRGVRQPHHLRNGVQFAAGPKAERLDRFIHHV